MLQTERVVEGHFSDQNGNNKVRADVAALSASEMEGEQAQEQKVVQQVMQDYVLMRTKKKIGLDVTERGDSPWTAYSFLSKAQQEGASGSYQLKNQPSQITETVNSSSNQTENLDNTLPNYQPRSAPLIFQDVISLIAVYKQPIVTITHGDIFFHKVSNVSGSSGEGSMNMHSPTPNRNLSKEDERKGAPVKASNSPKQNVPQLDLQYLKSRQRLNVQCVQKPTKYKNGVHAFASEVCEIEEAGTVVNQNKFTPYVQGSENEGPQNGRVLIRFNTDSILSNQKQRASYEDDRLPYLQSQYSRRASYACPGDAQRKSATHLYGAGSFRDGNNISSTVGSKVKGITSIVSKVFGRKGKKRSRSSNGNYAGYQNVGRRWCSTQTQLSSRTKEGVPASNVKNEASRVW